MSFVKYEPKGNIAYLIIDREKALNALNSQVLADLDAALDAVDLSEIRCLIVRGAGEKSFVAGADIAQMKELSKEEAEAFGKQGNDVMRKLEAFNGIPVAMLASCNPIGIIFTAIFMSMLDISGLQLTNLTAYNEYITNVIIAVIVYLSAFSLVIKMWIGKLGKKKDDGADANAEPAPAAASAPAGAQAETEKGGDAK